MSMEIFEAFMLICFGSAWPFAIGKSISSRSAGGKSPVFLVIIFLGYLSGICAHLVGHNSPVILLYGLNASMVATDLCLVLYFRRYPAGKQNINESQERSPVFKLKERRNRKRCKPHNNIIAVLRLGSIKTGVITDISLAGLSFEYYCRKKPEIEPSEMDILVPDFNRGIFFQKLAIDTVWDISLSKSENDGSAPVRKKGVVFKNVYSTQVSDLESFIRSYTAEYRMIALGSR